MKDSQFEKFDGMSLGINLREIRTGKGLSQDQLANQVTEITQGIIKATRSWIAAVEGGYIKSLKKGRLEGIAAALGIPFEELVHEIQHPARRSHESRTGNFTEQDSSLLEDISEIRRLLENPFYIIEAASNVITTPVEVKIWKLS